MSGLDTLEEVSEKLFATVLPEGRTGMPIMRMVKLFEQDWNVKMSDVLWDLGYYNVRELIEAFPTQLRTLQTGQGLFVAIVESKATQHVSDLVNRTKKKQKAKKKPARVMHVHAPGSLASRLSFPSKAPGHFNPRYISNRNNANFSQSSRFPHTQPSQPRFNQSSFNSFATSQSQFANNGRTNEFAQSQSARVPQQGFQPSFNRNGFNNSVQQRSAGSNFSVSMPYSAQQRSVEPKPAATTTSVSYKAQQSTSSELSVELELKDCTDKIKCLVIELHKRAELGTYDFFEGIKGLELPEPSHMFVQRLMTYFKQYFSIIFTPSTVLLVPNPLPPLMKC